MQNLHSDHLRLVDSKAFGLNPDHKVKSPDPRSREPPPPNPAAPHLWTLERPPHQGAGLRALAPPVPPSKCPQRTVLCWIPPRGCTCYFPRAGCLHLVHLVPTAPLQSLNPKERHKGVSGPPHSPGKLQAYLRPQRAAKRWLWLWDPGTVAGSRVSHLESPAPQYLK